MKTLPALLVTTSVLGLSCLRLPVASYAADAVPSAAAPDLFRKENLAAWCIVPFDRSKRNPEQRAEMLERIQLKKFVYDYRAEHVPQWEEELQALQRHGIELSGWMFNPAPDKEDRSKLNAQSEGLLEMFDRYQFKPQLWIIRADGQIAMPSQSDHERRVRGEVASLKPAALAAQAHGLKLGLYNHGGWWGEPENQIEIIEGLKKEGIQNVGIVYNLHHGHDHLGRFPQMLQKMLPYLICLNLNGMDIAGQTKGRKILPIGVGTEDVSLLKIIRDSGYRGLIGILNHTGEDAEARLLDNLDGLHWLANQLEGKPASAKPVPRTFATTAPAHAQKPPVPIPAAAGLSSLNAAFGKALRGSLAQEGKAAYRAIPLTVECRAKMNGANGFNILVASDPKASADHWELYTYARSGVLSLYMPGRGGEIRSDVNICDGSWHAVAATIGLDMVRLFVDGKMVKEAPLRERSGNPLPGGLAIGSLVERSIGCDGLLDNVRISSGTREIGFPADVPLKTDAQTLGLWDFEDLPEAPSGALALTPATPTQTQPSNPAPSPTAYRAPAPVDRNSLAASFIVPAAAPERLTRTNGWPAVQNHADWERSLGGPTSNRFSSLTQITRENVHKLEPAWTYHSGDGAGNIQCNPIIVDGTMYVPTPGKYLVAVDAATGQERWRFSSATMIGIESQRHDPARRGLLYWRGDRETSARLLVGDASWLFALDPQTGKPVESFGEAGKVRVPMGTTAAGAMFEHVLVLPGYQGDVYGFDARNGKRLWTFSTRPKPGEYGSETWSTPESGANCWGGMAMDESRGIAFVATGSPKPNYFGMNHRGDNLFSNCVIALDALTGTRKWHFQELRHDIWDWDIPAPPNLVTVERYGMKVDAVAQVTKLGNTLLLDRVTGEPLYDFRLVRVDTHGLPGDETALYQPAPELPEPFARSAYTEADLPTLPGAKEALLPLFQRANSGPFPSFDEARPTLMFNIHGGAEWTGAAANPQGFLFVTSNEIPWSITCFRDDDPDPVKPPTAGEQVFQTICVACHGADRRGVGHAPPLRGLRHRMGEDEVRAVLKNGRNGMPAVAFLSEDQIKPLVDFLLCRDRPESALAKPKANSWTFGGFVKVRDSAGYPGCSPPWGTLHCINLNTGRKAWSVPLGEYDELSAKGVPVTGQENFGGAMVTASGLVFVSGTSDRKIRAFDAESGKELWSFRMPMYGTAPPASYEVGGRQFVVLPATGGGKLGWPAGDAWTAFALPVDLVNRP